MASNQIVTIECHKPEATLVKNFLYQLFNQGKQNQERPAQRLGHYNTRALPVPSQIKSGTKGSLNQIKTLRKHQAILSSCKVAKSSDISNLTNPVDIEGKQYTLLDILHTLTYPLCPAEGTKSSPLFHCIDRASSGRDMSQGIVYFVAYKDRFEIVEKLVAVLPQFIEFRFNRQVAEKFFHLIAIEDCSSVTWECSDQNQSYATWTGNWTTQEEEQMLDLLEEDMGIKIQLDNLEMLKQMGNKVIAHDDALSVTSFGTDLREGDADHSTGKATQGDASTAQAATGDNPGGLSGSA